MTARNTGYGPLTELVREASPRPWYFDGRDIFTTGPTDDTGGHRLVVPLPNTFHPSQRVSDADAHLIVQAVNEYDYLLALEAFVRETVDRGDYEPGAMRVARAHIASLDAQRWVS